ncbi:hypothetical protein PC113_g20329 [Phytophthora cactorum]|uniref:Uncharacterized protein n=1 Tax=Phytophthora cactorum TaxID=29920 RepID=A0A8T0Y336_9STRA|nr:hypothetical protein PC113_g20329 [Phytophthora cactorum]
MLLVRLIRAPRPKTPVSIGLPVSCFYGLAFTDPFARIL